MPVNWTNSGSGVGSSVGVGVTVVVGLGPSSGVLVVVGVWASKVLCTAAARVASGVKTASSGGDIAYLISA